MLYTFSVKNIMLMLPGFSYEKTPRYAAFQVFLTNFSLQRGQVMEILPLPLGTRTRW